MKFIRFIDWNRQHEIPGILACICSIFLLASIVSVYLRWNEIKGSYFVNPAELSQTTGTITSSRTYCGSSKGGAIYHFEIHYKFLANGRDYESDQVTFTVHFSKDRNVAEGYALKYPVGKNVTVFYQASNPSFSVLEPETRNDNSFITFLGVELFFIIIGYAWFGYIHFIAP